MESSPASRCVAERPARPARNRECPLTISMRNKYYANDYLRDLVSRARQNRKDDIMRAACVR